MSLQQNEKVSRILLNNPRREEELDLWERTLTCRHVVEQSVHHSKQRPSFSTAWCPDREMTRGIVSSVKTVEAATRMARRDGSATTRSYVRNEN